MWYKQTWVIIVLTIIFFPAGLFLMWKYAKWNKWLKIGVSTALAVIVIATVANPQDQQQPSASSSQSSNASKPETSQSKPVATVPNYKVTYELSGKRYDGGKYYYVQSDPIGISNQGYKDDVRAIVNDMVAKNGNKITIEVHDNEESLSISYKQYGDMSLGRPRTAAEDTIQARHYVATFSGDLETNTYKNTLDFFPAATKQNLEVGQFIGSEEFNP